MSAPRSVFQSKAGRSKAQHVPVTKQVSGQLPQPATPLALHELTWPALPPLCSQTATRSWRGCCSRRSRRPILWSACWQSAGGTAGSCSSSFLIVDESGLPAVLPWISAAYKVQLLGVGGPTAAAAAATLGVACPRQLHAAGAEFLQPASGPSRADCTHCPGRLGSQPEPLNRAAVPQLMCGFKLRRPAAAERPAFLVAV